MNNYLLEITTGEKQIRISFPSDADEKRLHQEIIDLYKKGEVFWVTGQDEKGNTLTTCIRFSQCSHCSLHRDYGRV